MVSLQKLGVQPHANPIHTPIYHSVCIILYGFTGSKHFLYLIHRIRLTHILLADI